MDNKIIKEDFNKHIGTMVLVHRDLVWGELGLTSDYTANGIEWFPFIILECADRSSWSLVNGDLYFRVYNVIYETEDQMSFDCFAKEEKVVVVK